MSFNPESISNIQYEWITKWHENDNTEINADNNNNKLFYYILKNNEANFKLWHNEDIARKTTVKPEVIMNTKREIDKWNQKRNDLIEKIDELFIENIQSKINIREDAKMNSETVGSIIDRLSILNLKIYHTDELSKDKFYNDEQKRKFEEKLRILKIQERDLVKALIDLIEDIQSGERYIKIYRQYKLYNDKLTNPQLRNE